MSGFYKLVAAAGVLATLWCVVAVRRSADPQSFVQRADAPPRPVKILMFYASAGMLVTGEKAQLCYGVENAKSVSIAPLTGVVAPATRRCLEIVPKHTTHYTILAEGYDGKVAMQSLTLAVRSPSIGPGPLVNWARASAFSAVLR
jgi:hypothetical protein